MQFQKYLKKKLPFFVATSALMVLASCGSYQYAGNDNDGIYSSGNEPTREVVRVIEEEPATTNESGYFKNYFSEKSKEYDELVSDNEIFTDIDSYQGYEQEVDSTERITGYAGWGQENSSETEIVIINNGWNNFGWARPWGWGWNRFGWGWGWNDPWFWNGGFGWGWNAGFGWGWNNPWVWNRGFGWGWHNYWCPPHFNNNFYYRGNRGIAYNYGRRGSYLNRTANLGRRNSIANSRLARRSVDAGRSLTRRNTSNIRRNSTIGRNNSSISRPRSSTRPRVNSTSRPRTRVNSTSRPRTRVNSPSRPRTRVNTPSRSNRPSVSRGGSSMRSSGGSRSSRGSVSRGGGRRR